MENLDGQQPQATQFGLASAWSGFTDSAANLFWSVPEAVKGAPDYARGLCHDYIPGNPEVYGCKARTVNFMGDKWGELSEWTSELEAPSWTTVGYGVGGVAAAGAALYGAVKAGKYALACKKWGPINNPFAPAQGRSQFKSYADVAFLGVACAVAALVASSVIGAGATLGNAFVVGAVATLAIKIAGETLFGVKPNQPRTSGEKKMNVILASAGLAGTVLTGSLFPASVILAKFGAETASLAYKNVSKMF